MLHIGKKKDRKVKSEAPDGVTSWLHMKNKTKAQGSGRFARGS